MKTNFSVYIYGTCWEVQKYWALGESKTNLLLKVRCVIIFGFGMILNIKHIFLKGKNKNILNNIRFDP